ncbi:MAG: ABC transporter ATP-binding protein/permease [Deltaproteobacteria bacterium]|nr:ABC transporter ATP-binding protein/permease [Deltaproteobacteria bacterium]
MAVTPKANVSTRRAMLQTLVWPLVRNHRKTLFLAAALIPLSALTAMLVPYLTKVALDEYIVPAAGSGRVEEVSGPLGVIATLAGLVVLAEYVIDALYTATLQRASMAMLTDLRGQVFRHTLRLPRSHFDRNPIGSILTRVTSDFEALIEGLASGVLSLVLDAMKMAAYLGAMFFLNWRLTLLVLLLAPVLVFLIQYFQERVRHWFFKARFALSEATGYLQECLNGMKTVQLFAAENLVLQKFTEKNHQFLHAQNKSNWYDALLFSLVEGITSLALGLMLWYAAGEILTGLITLGVLVAFMEYIQKLFLPVKEISQDIAVLQRAWSGLEHIHHLMNTPPDPAQVPERLPASGIIPSGGPARLTQEPLETVTFDNVGFRYLPDGPPVLSGVSFSLRAGGMLALVGATGSGKSSLIRLLTRGYGGYTGSIRLNDRELSTISAQELARWISVVHQTVFLFKGTIADNIALGNPTLTRAQIEQAARYVHAHPFIEQLPLGYDHPVAPGGGNLSAGQAQLISFARAVAAGAPLIVLDEATASVDSMTEQWIRQGLDSLYQGKTVIAIAHRLSTVRHAGNILVMDKGRVMESGNHQQLLAQQGLYAALVGTLQQEDRP